MIMFESFLTPITNTYTYTQALCLSLSCTHTSVHSFLLLSFLYVFLLTIFQLKQILCLQQIKTYILHSNLTHSFGLPLMFFFSMYICIHWLAPTISTILHHCEIQSIANRANDSNSVFYTNENYLLLCSLFDPVLHKNNKMLFYARILETDRTKEMHMILLSHPVAAIVF